ncbi:MAG: CBS domain-containing protein [Rhizobium sp.]
MQARDIMTTKIVSIDDCANVRHAIRLMIENEISGLPVLDRLGRVCGMLTEGDLLSRCEIGSLQQSCADIGKGEDALLNYIRSKAWRVGDVMTPNIIAVTPDTPLPTIAKLLASHSIKRVLVLDEGRLVGLVSRRDLLRAIADMTPDAIAPGDDALKLAVTTRLRTELGLGTERINVAVHNARVRLTGSIDSELQRQAIRVLVERIGSTYGYIDEMHVAPGLLERRQ